MHIHIVCRNFVEDQIIPRLARSLAHWTLGASPDPTADLNYFFPYLELTATRNLFDQTWTAAWRFTHLEVSRPPEKAQQWGRAARGGGICVNLIIGT